MSMSMTRNSSIIFNPVQIELCQLSNVLRSVEGVLTQNNSANVEGKEIPDFQIILQSSQLPHSLRNMNADLMNKLVR